MRQKVEEECDTVRTKKDWPEKTNKNTCEPNFTEILQNPNYRLSGTKDWPEKTNKITTKILEA